MSSEKIIQKLSDIFSKIESNQIDNKKFFNVYKNTLASFPIHEALCIKDDYYDKTMSCIAKGNEDFTSESDYDTRVIVPSMEKQVAEAFMNLVRNTKFISKFEDQDKLTITLLELKNDILDLISKNSSFEREKAVIEEHNQKLIKEMQEIQKKALFSGDKTGTQINIKNPDRFAKLIVQSKDYRDLIFQKINNLKQNSMSVPEDLELVGLYISKLIEIVEE